MGVQVTAEGTILYQNGNRLGPIPEHIYVKLAQFLVDKYVGSITFHCDGQGGVSKTEYHIFVKH